MKLTFFTLAAFVSKQVLTTSGRKCWRERQHPNLLLQNPQFHKGYFEAFASKAKKRTKFTPASPVRHRLN
jgi:hypothetical protein